MIVKFDVTDEILRFYDMVVLLHTALHRKAALILHQFPQFCPSQFTPLSAGIFFAQQKARQSRRQNNFTTILFALIKHAICFTCLL